MAGIYDLTLASGAVAQNIPALGELVKVVSAPGGAVRVRLDGGDAFQLLEGQGIRMPVGQQFRDVQVTNASGVAQRVLIFIGDSRFEDSRVTGVVSVVDGGKDRSIAGQAFIGYASVTAGAGNVPVVMLLNPGSATTRVILKTVRVSSPTAGNVSLGSHNAALAQGPFDSTNKRFGGASSVAKVYRDTPAAAGPGTVFEGFSIGAGLVLPLKLDEPVVLNPGQGVVAWHNTVATSILAAFEFVEESLPA